MKFMASFSSGHSLKHLDFGDFPGHLVVKNLPANARDTDLIPGPGGSRSLWSPEPVSHNYWAHVLQPLKPAAPEPVFCSERSHRDVKPEHHKQRVAPAQDDHRKPAHDNKEQGRRKPKQTISVLNKKHRNTYPRASETLAQCFLNFCDCSLLINYPKSYSLTSTCKASSTPNVTGMLNHQQESGEWC